MVERAVVRTLGYKLSTICFWCSLGVIYILRSLPFSLRQKLFFLLFYCAFAFSSARVKIKRNIALIRPDLSQAEISLGFRRFLSVLSKSWANLLEQKPLTRSEIEKRIIVEDAELLVRCHEAGDKIVLATIHTGPIDALFWIVQLLELRISVPVESIKPAWLFRLVKRLRAAKAPGIIFEPVERGKTFGKLAKHLEEKRIVGIAIDMTRSSNGVWCRIGRGYANFPAGAVKLAISEDALLIPALPFLEDNGKTKITLAPPFRLIKTNEEKEDVESNTRRLVEEIFAPHIQKYWYQWLRLPWANLEPTQD